MDCCNSYYIYIYVGIMDGDAKRTQAIVVQQFITEPKRCRCSAYYLCEERPFSLLPTAWISA